MADTQAHAQRAAKAVRISYEEMKSVVTIQVGVPSRHHRDSYAHPAIERTVYLSNVCLVLPSTVRHCSL